MKTCSTCNEIRPLSDFWRRPSSSDGYRGRCIPCSKKKQAEWVAANGERKRAADRSYHAQNREVLNAASKAAHHKHRAVRLAQRKTYRDSNPEKMRAANRRKRELYGERLRESRRRHYRENSARYKAQAIARRKHIRQATPRWADLDKIAGIYAEAERLSDETGIEHHVDHFYPLRGETMCGLHVEGNLRIIPMVDNLKKGNSVPIGVAGMLGV